MIKYWPKRQSISLNLAVSHIFTQTYQKITLNLHNKTHERIPLDAFSECTKKQLLLELLTEIEILVVDIVELNLSARELKQLNYQILLHLINATAKRLLCFLKAQKFNFSISFCSKYNQLFFQEHTDGANILLTYLIFGSESIEDSLFDFKSNKTPVYHIKALLENMLIQTCNTIVFNFIESNSLIRRLQYFAHDQNKIHYSHQSIRQISNFKNNLISQSLISFYIYYPQNIYCGKYSIYLLSVQGIIQKYIRFNRSLSYVKLSNCQLGSIIYLEIKDFINPKINQLVALFGKLIIYIFAEIISKNLNAGLKYAAKKISMQNTDS